ncbi:MAG: FkbM family methyltransferase [Deltaproteobacteria bacterium]|nr:MAG: FkbM family methyltransferase [Deltaproteobacteria bacterium]
MSLLHTLRFMMNHPLNQKQKSQALLRYLRWQLGSRLISGEVAYPWIAGAKFLLQPGETGLTGNIYNGLHEYSHMAYVLHTMNPDALFVDVGANVGSYTLLACAVRKARGYAFEPVPQTYERLMANLHLNNLAERVTAMNLGLSDEEGELAFVVDENCTNHVLRPTEEAANVTRVNVRTMDDVLQKESPSLLKVDVEGFETPVIHGALKTLQKESLHSVIMELGGAGNQYGYDEDELLKHMLSLGFRTYEYDPMTRSLTDLNHQAFGEKSINDNILLIRDLDKVKQLLATTPPVELNGLSF